MTPQRERTRLGIVALTIFLDLLGFGIIIPLMPQYAESYGAGPLGVGLLMSCYSLMQFLFVPIWRGRISDRVGRRPVLLVSIAGSVVSFTLLGTAGSLAALFAARILAGLFTANFSVAQAYVADVTRPEDRARGMGLVGAAFGLGFVVGPFIGGELYPVTAHLPFGFVLRHGTAPFFFAAVLSAANWGMAFRLLPESLVRKSGPPGRRDSIFSGRRLYDAVRRPKVGPLFVVFFLATFSFSMMEATLILFGQRRLAMTPVQAGRFLGYIGVLMVLVQGGLVGRLAKRFGEARILVLGASLTIPGLFLIAPSSSYLALALAMIPLSVGSGMSSPCLNSLLSRLSRGDEQGGVLGINQSLGSLARVLGPAIGTVAFGRLGIGSPYLLGGSVSLLAAVLAAVAVRPFWNAKPEAGLPAGLH